MSVPTVRKEVNLLPNESSWGSGFEHLSMCPVLPFIVILGLLWPFAPCSLKTPVWVRWSQNCLELGRGPLYSSGRGCCPVASTRERIRWTWHLSSLVRNADPRGEEDWNLMQPASFPREPLIPRLQNGLRETSLCAVGKLVMLPKCRSRRRKEAGVFAESQKSLTGPKGM